MTPTQELGLEKVAVWSVRPNQISDSGATIREPGASDVSVLAACSRFDSQQRWFRHESPLELPSLNLRRLREGIEPSDVDMGLLRAMQAEVHRYSDAMARIRASTPERTVLHASAEVLRAWYLDPDEKDAPESLIYRIAREDRGRLAALCVSPRVLLRRERRMVPLDRARQLDAQSMRWLDKQPGEDLVQKAGSRQRIQAVVRNRSTDTLENRVLKDCLLRAVHAAREYRQENLRFATGQAVKKVERFERQCDELVKFSEIARVPAIVGIPVPNYVLQNDARYKHLWRIWIQLVRREQVTQSLVNWAARWVAEIGFVSTLASLSKTVIGQPRWSQDLWLRSEPVHGEYCDPAAPIGSSESTFASRPVTIDVVRGGQLARAAWPDAWRHLVSMAPDFILLPRGPLHRSLPVWSCVLWNKDHADRFAATLQRLRDHLGLHRIQGLIVVIAPESFRGLDSNSQMLQVVHYTSPRDVMENLGEFVIKHLKAQESVSA
jgi:hypothetical protein